MRRLSIQVAAICMAASLAAIAPQARADVTNKKTVVTFHKPVEIPGMVLVPGTYVMKLADSEGDQHLVEFLYADETHVYATVLAAPASRMEPAGKTVITFEERASDAPEALKTWFFPGDSYGQEFVYPKH